MQKIKTNLYRIHNSIAFKIHCHFKRNRGDSVYFYTFHKCASTLFTGYVLKNIVGLWHVDYAREIYRGSRSKEKMLHFEKSGVIYGPIRLSAQQNHPVRKLLVDPTTKSDFVRNKTSIILIRDPRDILVSAHYSFGFTHGISPQPSIAENQEARRKYIRKMSLDEYVLQKADKQIEYFKIVSHLVENSNRSVVLRYEDMINDFDFFAEQLCKYLDLSQSTIDEIRRRSRPREKEDKQSHRRSGKPGGFRSKLKNETVLALNQKLKEPLLLYGYDE